MNLSYTMPLRRAWDRSQRLLFRPFHLRNWLVLGFAAFLSEALVTGRGLQSSYQLDQGGAPGAWLHGVSGLLGSAMVAGLGIVLVAAIVCISLILLWVNSRGRFVFLEGVLRERAAIVEPWKRHARAGNSVFAWMVFFGLVCVALVALLILPFLATLAALWGGGGFRWELLGALWVMIASAIPVGIVVAYTLLFLSDFVVPIMVRHGLGVTAAWSRFLGLLRSRPGPFLLYGLMVFGLWLAVGIAVMAIGFSTCCIGFVFFGLPYVSSVVLLPVLVTFRGLGPEFLAQFGPEYSLMGVSEPGGAGPAGTSPASAGASTPPGAGA